MNLTQPQTERTAGERRLYWGAQGTAIASAIVALTVATLLAISWLTVGRARPLDSPVMARLIREIGADPGNAALREQVRDLDVLARRAYLESLAFRRRGALLLLLALGTMLGSLKLMAGTAKHAPTPALSDDDSREVRTLSGAAILCFLAFLGGLVFVYAREAPRSGALPPPSPPPATVPSLPAVKPSIPQAAATQPPVTVVDESLAASYWPAFRGWRGLGIGAQRTPPTEWNGLTGSNIVWKTKIPLPGFNSPVVWGEIVFVSGADATNRAIYAFNAVTGVLLWEANVAIPNVPARKPSVHEDTGYAASSMACDSRHVYSIFANGDLICLDHAGRKVWGRNLDVTGIAYGYASSLLAFDGRLFVQCDIGEKSVLLAFDAATGAELWRADRGDSSAWCSPIMAMHKGTPMLVLNGVRAIAAYAPDSGAPLWTATGQSGEIAPSLASADGLVLAAMSGSGSLAIRLEDGSVAWEKFDIDAPEIPSPVMADGLAFVVSDHGVVTCLQASNGTIKWQHEFDATFNASPLILGGHLYLTDTAGRSYVLKAGDTFELVGSGQLGEGCYATPAAVGNRLFLRGVRHLFCVGVGSK